MPYKFEYKKIRLPKDKDRRRAITDKQRLEIKQLYKAGFSIRAISRLFNGKCSRRLIQFIIYPERLEKVKEQYKERNQSAISYAKNRGKKWAKIIREHRRYKQKTVSCSAIKKP